MNKAKTIIGLIGEKGSGKETVGNFIIENFSSQKVVRVRSSDILSDTLKEWGLPLNRHNLQYLAIIMDKGFGSGTLSTAVRKRIDSLDADIVIFDGIRWKTDVALLRSFSHNFLIYVTASTETRYERIKERKEKVGENLISFEQFMEDEKVDTEIHIPELGKRADAFISNLDSQENLKVKIEECLLNLKL